MNKNAIFFAINNDYSFALANVLLSLLENSPKIMSLSDIIIMHSDISDKNKDVLKKILPTIQFRPLFKDFPTEILSNDLVAKSRWGIFCLQKLAAFDLIKEYDKVLGLEADMFITQEISELLDIDCDIAFREVGSWRGKDLLKTIIKEDETPPAAHGGVILFSSSIAKYGITKSSILNSYNYIKNFRNNVDSIEERVITHLSYVCSLKVFVLDSKFNKTSPHFDFYEDKIIHLSGKSRPWNNPVVLSLLPEWYKNHQIFISLGGTCPDFPLNIIPRRKFYYEMTRSQEAIEIISNLEILKEKNFYYTYNCGEYVVRIYDKIKKLKMADVWFRDSKYSLIIEFNNREVAFESIQNSFKFVSILLESKIKNCKYSMQNSGEKILIEVKIEKQFTNLNKVLNFLISIKSLIDRV